jgi:hypothetical protein
MSSVRLPEGFNVGCIDGPLTNAKEATKSLNMMVTGTTTIRVLEKCAAKDAIVVERRA